MQDIDCTLLCDGSSDKMLIPAIKWLLIEHNPDIAFNFEYATISGKKSLSEKICLALELFPCDILFIQRDTEKESIEKRRLEIQENISTATCTLPKTIAVIPKRMSEAWLLIDEQAIKRASGNPNGKVNLILPKIKKLESLPNPKNELERLLEEASELSKRRLKAFNTRAAIHIVAESIDDYSSLRNLVAFNALESDIESLEL